MTMLEAALLRALQSSKCFAKNSISAFVSNFNSKAQDNEVCGFTDTDNIARLSVSKHKHFLQNRLWRKLMSTV